MWAHNREVEGSKSLSNEWKVSEFSYYIEYSNNEAHIPPKKHLFLPCSPWTPGPWPLPNPGCWRPAPSAGDDGGGRSPWTVPASAFRVWATGRTSAAWASSWIPCRPWTAWTGERKNSAGAPKPAKEKWPKMRTNKMTNPCCLLNKKGLLPKMFLVISVNEMWCGRKKDWKCTTLCRNQENLLLCSYLFGPEFVSLISDWIKIWKYIFESLLFKVKHQQSI